MKKVLPGGPVFIEGSLTQTLLTDKAGRELLSGIDLSQLSRRLLIQRRLPAGDYELSTVERPCDGNCDFLDDPFESTRCQLNLRVEPGETTRVRLELRADQARGAMAACSVSQRAEAGASG